MKITRFSAFFLAVIILMTPIVMTSITIFSEVDSKYEFVDYNEGEDEQNDERETEENEKKDEVKEFLVQNQFDPDYSKFGDLNSRVQNLVFTRFLADILTPPPDLG